MGAFSFVRYSFEGVLRNGRRSLFAVLGIALAMALVSGSLIAVDSSAYGLLRSTIDKVPVDFTATQSVRDNATFSMSRINLSAESMLSVKNVKEVTPAPVVPYWVAYNPARPNATYTSCELAFLPHDSAGLLSRLGISGEMPDPGTVAIPEALATSLGVGVSDRITLSIQRGLSWIGNTTPAHSSIFLNKTFTISQTWSQDSSAVPYGPVPIMVGTPGQATVGPYVSLPGLWGTPVVTNLESFDSVVNSDVRNFTVGSGQLETLYYVQTDRAHVIDLSNIDASIAAVQFIQNRLTYEGRLHDFTVSDSPLISSLQGMQPQLESQKVLFLALSLPVVALGTYLSVVGVDLGVTSRRREIGILKSRGAGNQHVFFSLMLESILLGAFAAVVGLLMGVLVSRFLLGSALSLSGGTGGASWTDLRLSAGSIELTIFFGVGLMLLSSWRPFKRASKTDVAEALHQYSQAATSTEYKARTDLILLALSILSILSILWGFNWVSNTGWSWITKLILAAVMIFGIALFPVMPFLLSLSVVRLMTRGPRKLYSRFGWFVKGWTKDLHQLVEKNIVRNPRRASNIAVIISLAIAFGLFISVTMESSIGLAKEQVKYDVGADIKISSYSSSSTMNYSKLGGLRAIEGVAHVALVENLYLNYYANGAYGLQLAVTNTTEYQKAVNPTDFYFVHSGKGVLGDLHKNGTVVVSSDFANQASVLMGDKLQVNVQIPDARNSSNLDMYPLELTVIGMVKGLPGIGWLTAIVDERTLAWIPQEGLQRIYQSPTALIDISSGGNISKVASAASALFTSAGFTPTVQTMDDQLAQLKKDVSFAALSDYLYMEYAMSIVIMSVGVGLIIFVAVADRERELACIMARGSSASQMRKILMGESFTLMLLGLTVGAIVGLLSAYLYNTLTLPSYTGVVPHRMLFTYATWAMVLVAGLSLVLAAFLATARAGMIRLTEVLRVRGG